MQVRFLFEHVARYGNTIHPKHMVFRPYYVTWENNKTDFYTLLMLGMYTNSFTKKSDERRIIYI